MSAPAKAPEIPKSGPSPIVDYCPRCEDYVVAMDNDRCGWCSTPVTDGPPAAGGGVVEATSSKPEGTPYDRAGRPGAPVARTELRAVRPATSPPAPHEPELELVLDDPDPAAGTPDLLAEFDTAAPPPPRPLTVEQQECLLMALRSIQGRALRACDRIIQGGAITGHTQFRKIEQEARDTLRWVEHLEETRR